SRNDIRYNRFLSAAAYHKPESWLSCGRENVLEKSDAPSNPVLDCSRYTELSLQLFHTTHCGFGRDGREKRSLIYFLVSTQSTANDRAYNAPRIGTHFRRTQ